jgi:uncharacterized protein YjaZ
MRNAILLIIIIFFVSQLNSQNVLNQDDVYFVDSIATNTICFHTNMRLIDNFYYAQIIKSIKSGVIATGNIIEFKNIEFRVLVFPERTIPRIGMSGVAPNTHQIYILLDPDHPKLNEAINIHIFQTIPHEYHHTMRYRTVGFGKNLFEALISEGLACHFAMEVCQIDPPEYCVAYTEKELDKCLDEAKRIWFQQEFDYYDWFVGRTKPKNIGYAMGYSLVEDYMKKHPGKKASALYATPAEKFLPQQHELF